MENQNLNENIPQATINLQKDEEDAKKQFCSADEKISFSTKDFQNNHSLDLPQVDQNSEEGGVEREDEELEEEEPNWEAISLHEPAKSDVPIFLSARNRRETAFSRFSEALDECHASLKHSVDELLTTAAKIHHDQSEKLDELEMEIKQYCVGNEQKRAVMHKRLEESATAAQGLFSQLLMRVSQPFSNVCGDLKQRLENQKHETVSCRKRPFKESEEVNDYKRPCNIQEQFIG